jgi:hypothetical protein
MTSLVEQSSNEIVGRSSILSSGAAAELETMTEDRKEEEKENKEDGTMSEESKAIWVSLFLILSQLELLTSKNKLNSMPYFTRLIKADYVGFEPTTSATIF